MPKSAVKFADPVEPVALTVHAEMGRLHGRARLAVIRRLLLSTPHDGRDLDAIGEEDENIIGEPAAMLG